MDRYQVALNGFPGSEVAFVSAMRVVGKISLADASRVFRKASNAKRTVLVAGIDLSVAEHIAAVFTAAGIPVTVHPSSVTSPMICRPQAEVAYRITAARMVVAVQRDFKGDKHVSVDS